MAHRKEVIATVVSVRKKKFPGRQGSQSPHPIHKPSESPKTEFYCSFFEILKRGRHADALSLE